MIDAIIAGIRFVLDPLLNPLLYLGQDWALIITAILEALMVVLIRKWTTPQERLHRIAHDVRMQKHLAALAAARGDHAAARIHKALRARLSFSGLRYEGLPLLLSVPAVLILAAWGYAHLPYRPAIADADLTVNLYSQQLSRAGEVVVLEAPAGVAIVGGPVRSLRGVTDPAETLGLPPYSMATWTVRASAAATSAGGPEARYVLRLVEGDRVHEHPLRVGGRLFEPSIIAHPSTIPAATPDAPPEITTQVVLKDFKLFDYIKQPTISPPPVWIFATMPTLPEMPPWMFAYILIILPFYFLWKRLLRIA